MKSIIKDWYTGENIPVETRLPFQTTARAGAGNEELERPVHRHFFPEPERATRTLCDREEFAGLPGDRHLRTRCGARPASGFFEALG